MGGVIKRAREAIQNLVPYSSARTESMQQGIHLDANENPFWREDGLNRYPNPQPALLRQQLAHMYGIQPSQLLMTRGSDEGIDLLTRVFCEANKDAIVITPPTFIDRDGTLIDEPADKQIDSLAKLELEPGVVPALLRLKSLGYRFVMLSNQDGLGSSQYPQGQFDLVQEKLLSLLSSQGINFDAIHICPHWESDGCECRKPNLGLVLDYLAMPDLDRQRSYVIGDRETDSLLVKKIRQLTHTPLIASGGAGSALDFLNVFKDAQVDGALAASVFHDRQLSINDLKNFLAQQQIVVRL